jgi:uncharacterized repeat protein (TIGR01451 family)
LALALGGKAVSAWTPSSSCDFLTGGGFIYPSGAYTGRKANFGVAGGCKHGSGLGNPPAPYFGHLEYQDKAANLKVHWKTITGYMVDSVLFPDPNARLICGTASTNRGNVTFIVRAKDADHVRNSDDSDNWDDWDDDKDGRNNDEFDIQLQGAVTYSTFPTGPHQLGGGNIRLHKPNNSTSGVFGGSCPGLPAPDVSVSKTTSTPTVAAGDQAIYNITVTAGGTGNSANVMLSDALPASHTWIVSGPDAASCTIMGSNLSCAYGTMAAGTTRSISVSTTTVVGDCANGLDNTATVTATTDVNPNNNSSGPVHIAVTCTASFTLTVNLSSVSSTSGSPGGTVTSDVNHPGINCTVASAPPPNPNTQMGACSAPFAANATVTLTATANGSGFRPTATFNPADCDTTANNGTATAMCTVTMTADRTVGVTVSFQE